LHTGDPSIYGAIREQMDELDKLGIDYEVVPGVSSFQAAAAALKAELTAPEIAQAVVLARVGGRTPVPPGQAVEHFAKTGSTLCLFLSVHGIEELARELAGHYGDDCPVAVVFRASWPEEKIVRGRLLDIAEKVVAAGVEKTAMIVVGRALERGVTRAVSKLYSADFEHGYRGAK